MNQALPRPNLNLLHKGTNGQDKRAHSTLTELARCVKEEFNLTDYSEIVIRAAQEYNQSIHSTTNQKKTKKKKFLLFALGSKHKATFLSE